MYFFLHRNVLAAVPSAGSALPPGAPQGRRGRAGVPRASGARVAGAGHAWPAASPGAARAGAVGVALGHAGYTAIEKLESSFC